MGTPHHIEGVLQIQGGSVLCEHVTEIHLPNVVQLPLMVREGNTLRYLPPIVFLETTINLN